MQGQERALFGSEPELTLDKVLYEDPGNMPHRQQESRAMALTKDEVCFVEETARKGCVAGKASPKRPWTEWPLVFGRRLLCDILKL